MSKWSWRGLSRRTKGRKISTGVNKWGVVGHEETKAIIYHSNQHQPSFSVMTDVLRELIKLWYFIENQKLCAILLFKKKKNGPLNINPRLCQTACRAEGVCWEAASCPASGFRSGGQHSGGGSSHQKPPRTGPALWTGLHMSIWDV